MQSMIIARRILFWASLVGLFASTYLWIVYAANAPIVCGISHGCDTVRASEWAYVFGVIPRPALGVLFYGFFTVLLILRAMFPTQWPVWAYRLTVLFAVIGFGESAWLVWIQYAYIQAFCDWCLVSAASATVLFVTSFWDKPTALTPQQSFAEIRWQFLCLVGAATAGVVGLWWLL